MYVCVYTYFTAHGTDPFAFGNGPELWILAVRVTLIITFIAEQHLRGKEREGVGGD